MEIKEKVITEIKKIYDPEIPVNIYELGLIYDVTVDNDNKVYIKEVKDVDLDLVWDPPWDKSMMSEAAKLELNL